ncbi:aminoglycoside phosphotransferase family protein [Pseudonocardiaceae bacterium YIM PH 21723]|nr:aminoglycoside phosphotransferase family protein [Pseudonocardiaceae bacterium YIM PH 21723]
MHAGQPVITEPIVRDLVDRQFPEWRELPVRRIGVEGTDNAIFRIGADLVARFPLRPEDPEQASRSLAAAGLLAGRTRFRTPEPVALGEPGSGYPLQWAVQTWVPGTPATEQDPGESDVFARDLAELVREIRKIDTGGRGFSGGWRGGSLTDHDEWLATCFDRSEALVDVPPLRRMWAGMRELPRDDGPDVLSHRDLLPGNLLVDGGRLAGVIDVGELAPADPALDLMTAWSMLDDGPRAVFRAELGCTDLEWERGRAWAFEQAMGVLWYYAETNPGMSRRGLRVLRRLMAG